jgi:diaminopimelate epimerase
MKRDIPFIKYQALGNDFVMIEASLLIDDVNDMHVSKRVADRRYGVGCDQVIFYTVCDTQTVSLRFFNQDGSEAEACGNGSRSFASFWLHHQGLSACVLKTKGADVHAHSVIHGNDIRLTFPVPLLKRTIAPAELGITFDVLYDPVLISVGNPHLVCFTHDKGAIHQWGAYLAKHPVFPDGVNVNCAHIDGNNTIILRVRERGAGLTPACGTGALATAYAAYHYSLIHTAYDVSVHQEGGILSHILTSENIQQMGDAHMVFSGIFFYDTV